MIGLEDWVYGFTTSLSDEETEFDVEVYDGSSVPECQEETPENDLEHLHAEY